MSESDDLADVAALEALFADAAIPRLSDDGSAHPPTSEPPPIEREPNRDTFAAPPMDTRVEISRLPYDTEAPPVSARQPRDDARLVDDALAGLDDEEDGPPTSGEVTSQRQPSSRAGELPAESWDDAVATLAPPGMAVPAAFDRARVPSDTVRARGRVAWSEPPFEGSPEVRIVSEPAPLPAPMPTGVGDAVAGGLGFAVGRYVGAVREGRPPTFGELIEASLALGAEREPDED